MSANPRSQTEVSNHGDCLDDGGQDEHVVVVTRIVLLRELVEQPLVEFLVLERAKVGVLHHILLEPRPLAEDHVVVAPGVVE